MPHSAEPGPNFPSRVAASWYSCECGKRGYFNRAAARSALRWTKLRLKEEPRSKILHVYRCPTGNGFFHVGHSFRTGPNLNARFSSPADEEPRTE